MKETSKKGKQLGFKESRTYMGIFDYSVVCVMGDQKNIREYVAWKFEDKSFLDYQLQLETPRGQCWHAVGYVPVIWIPRYPKTPREYATLSHECLHAVYHLMEWASIPMTRDTEEVVTHAMAHIVNTILEDFRNTKREGVI